MATTLSVLGRIAARYEKQPKGFFAMPQPSSVHSLSRRDILKQAAVGGFAVAAVGKSKLAAVEPETRSLRVIAYNVYKCTGWPKDGSTTKRAIAKGQMPDRFANELALYEPDIINFSESPKISFGKLP